MSFEVHQLYNSYNDLLELSTTTITRDKYVPISYNSVIIRIAKLLRTSNTNDETFTIQQISAIGWIQTHRPTSSMEFIMI